MDTNLLLTKFTRIGARLKVAAGPAGRDGIALDVRADRKGEYFEIVPPAGETTEVAVLDVQPADRHLLLLVREPAAKAKFLCGHDERHWFVAGIPEAAPVGTVRQAKDALKPAEVRTAQAAAGLSAKQRDRRKNAAFLRQGEWFFLPAPGVGIDPARVHRNEPLTRGNGGKPHWTDFLYRTGGETVYVCRQHPAGVPEAAYRRILQTTAGARKWGWRPMQREPRVYVKGRVRHADHATIWLPDWHRVVMNTEGQSRAMRHVVFLD